MESPKHIDSHPEHDSNEEWEAVSYPVTTMGYNSDYQVTTLNEVLSEEFTLVEGRVKISANLREHIKMTKFAHDELGETEPLEIHSNLVEVFSHITPEDMAAFQKGDNQISIV